jgi:hypothetical protein
MQVKELIQQLQKQNQEDEIHIWVDDEVGAGGAGEYEKYYATRIKILGHDIYYKNEDNIMNEDEIGEYVLSSNSYDLFWDELEIAIYDEINNRKELKGCWLYIQP